MRNFIYERPMALDEAINIYNHYGSKARLIAGGTDILVEMKLVRESAPEVMVSLNNVEELSGISWAADGGLIIGSMTTIATVAKHPVIKSRYYALAQAAGQVGSVQVRNLATIGGNVARSSPSADTLPALAVFNAEILVAGPNGKRIIPLQDFHIGPRVTVLQQGELITKIIIPANKSLQSSYIKHGFRKAMEISVAGVAVAICMDANGQCQDVRIALGSVAPTVIRATKAENFLVGKKPEDQVIQEAADQALKAVSAINDFRASAEYRTEMVKVLTIRAIKQVLQLN